ncbi:hypothetical protein HK100_012265, partial [Physocladia obscura]
MKWVTSLPSQEEVPYKFIEAEPHFKDVVRYFRTSDYIAWGSIATGVPAAMGLF